MMNQSKYILKNKARVVLLALSFTIALASCKKDFLVAEPELNLNEAQAWESPARVLAQINGLYSTGKSGALFGGRYFIYNDIRAEEFTNRTNNGVTGLTVYNATQTSGDTYITNFWSQGYLLINRINVFLDGLEKNKSILTTALYENYKAEAKFLRGYTYFSLVQIFAKPYVFDNGASRGMPLRLLAEKTKDNNELRSSSVAEIYTQILKDLNDAEAGLPNNYSSALLNTTRAHKNSAIAIKTRVYLTMKNYAKVIEEGNKIVPAAAPFKNTARAPHELQANIVNVFAAPFTTTESIWSMPMAETNTPGTQNQIGYYFNAGNLEYILNVGGQGIYADADFKATDSRRINFIALYSGSTWYHTKKFSGATPYTDYVPQIRYAEVLLNVAEAEALVSGGDLARAKALLEAVRHRSDPSYVVTASTSVDLEAAILKERRIEFLSEGHRYNNLARKAASLPSVGAGSVIPVTDQRYTYKIPDAEIYYNPKAEW